METEYCGSRGDGRDCGGYVNVECGLVGRRAAVGCDGDGVVAWGAAIAGESSGGRVDAVGLDGGRVEAAGDG